MYMYTLYIVKKKDLTWLMRSGEKRVRGDETGNTKTRVV